MILTMIVPKAEVEKVTVVEINSNVISLVEKYIRDYLGSNSKKLEIINSNIYDFVPKHKYNTVFFDIWGNYSSGTYEETKILHRKFSKYLDRTKPHWIDSWMRWYMRAKYFNK